MSDCFDHAADAADDLCFGHGWNDSDSPKTHYRREYNPLGKTCKFCKTPYLHWYEIDGRWRLCVDGVPHTCSQYRSSKE